MFRAPAILMMLLLAFGPALSFSGSACVCTAPAGAGSEQAQPADPCCRSAETDQPDAPTPDDQPCDGQDCSLFCCSSPNTLALSHRPPARIAHAPSVATAAPPRAARAVPHLRELKRPPRSTPTA